jgi:hypothetical protein
MISPLDEVGRLEALILENSGSDTPSEEELLLAALGAANEPGAGSKGTLAVESLSLKERQLVTLFEDNNNPSSVPEDYVELNIIPGFDGSTPSVSSRGAAVSPMLSLASVSSGGSRGGSFSINSGKKFSVVKVFKGQGMCLADIGDGAKFCIKAGCSIASHKMAKNKFKSDDKGMITIAKLQDVAFALPILGGGFSPLMYNKNGLK